MKKDVMRRGLKHSISFVTGMATMALLIAVVIPASASWNEISYNQVGVRLFGEQVVVAGECYTAPNGQEVPSSITFTDTMGGKTNYFSVRQRRLSQNSLLMRLAAMSPITQRHRAAVHTPPVYQPRTQSGVN